MLGNWLKRSAPDWLTTVAFRAGLRVTPALRCTSSPTTSPGASLGTIAGPAAPPEWIDTLASASVQVTPETWIADLVHRDAFAAVVRYDGQVAGTASLTPIKGTQPSVGLVTWVGVRKEHQGRGLARPLFGACLDHARAAGMATPRSRCVGVAKEAGWVPPARDPSSWLLEAAGQPNRNARGAQRDRRNRDAAIRADDDRARRGYRPSN